MPWAGHQIHIALPINKLLDAGIAPQEIPLPHEFLINRELMAQLYPSFEKGLAPFFGGDWGQYSDFLTFKGGLNCCIIYFCWTHVPYKLGYWSQYERNFRSP